MVLGAALASSAPDFTFPLFSVQQGLVLEAVFGPRVPVADIRKEYGYGHRIGSHVVFACIRTFSADQ